jgi:hypothetical protein
MRRQLESSGRTTITGCNGKVHGWRVVEEEWCVKEKRFYRLKVDGEKNPGCSPGLLEFENKLD